MGKEWVGEWWKEFVKNFGKEGITESRIMYNIEQKEKQNLTNKELQKITNGSVRGEMALPKRHRGNNYYRR